MKNIYVASIVFLCVISVVLLILFYGNPLFVLSEITKAGEHYSDFIQTLLVSVIISPIAAAVLYVINDTNSGDIKH